MRKLLLTTLASVGIMAIGEVAQAQTAVSPAPGTISVRLNGRYRFFAAIVNDRDLENNVAGSPDGLTPLRSRNKTADYQFGNFAYLFPGFDGLAANGLKYGASLEIRQDNNSGAGGGQFGSISQQSRARNSLYYRRLWGYLGTDQLGTIRLGSTDGPSSLYMTGNFEDFDSGGWNGDHPGLLVPSAQLTWPFADVGNLNTGTKAVYLSPQLFGFDFGVSYEPNTGNGNLNSNCGSATFQATNFINVAGAFTTASGANATGAIGPGCDRLSSSPNNSESQRRRNTVDALLRYRGSFAGVGIAATGSYIGSANVKDNSGQPFSNTFQNGNDPRFQFEGLSVGDFGLAVTYGGLSVGGKYQFGRFNGQWSLAARGITGGEAWLAGASYTAGPFVVGAHYVDYKSAGDLANAALGRQSREQGLAVGSTYSLAPGVSVYASYLYTQRKQNGLDQITGQGVTADNQAGTLSNNKVIGSLIAIGTSFEW